VLESDHTRLACARLGDVARLAHALALIGRHITSPRIPDPPAGFLESWGDRLRFRYRTARGNCFADTVQTRGRNAGSSSAPLRGSTAAVVWPRIGSASTERPWRSCASPQSASCLENYAIRPEVPGRTLRSFSLFSIVCALRFVPWAGRGVTINGSQTVPSTFPDVLCPTGKFTKGTARAYKL
jgi:hypothetical protein